MSGALFILRIKYQYTRTRFEKGARDVNIIGVPIVTCELRLTQWAIVNAKVHGEK